MATQVKNDIDISAIKDEIRKELEAELKKQLSGDDYDEKDRPEAEYPWIVFSVDGTEYGVNSKYVLSIEILGEITPLVDAKSYSPGITKSRGEMIELIDLRALFGLGDYVSAKSEGNQSDTFMMVVIEVDDKKRGMIVDQVIAVEYITEFEDGALSGSDGENTSQYISKIAKREKIDKTLLIISPDNLRML